MNAVRFPVSPIQAVLRMRAWFRHLCPVWASSLATNLVRVILQCGLRLEPHDDMDLKMETVDSRFTAVELNTVSHPFWLPADVTVTLHWRGMLFRNRHMYSNFQLFRVDSPTGRF